MASDVNLYVYRINEREYGAGLGLAECEKRGSIVERWPLNTPEDAKFVATHGTSYGNAADQVTRIADRVHELMVLDPTFRTQPEAQIAQPLPISIPEPKRGFFARWLSWCCGQ